MKYIVYSKNRSMQLETHFLSAIEMVSDLDMCYAIYTYSNEEFGRGYELLKEKKYSKLTMIKETTFKESLVKIVSELPIPYIFCMGDDDYFIKPTRIQGLIDILMSDEKILSGSVRLSDKITKRGVVLSDMPIPEFIHHDDFLVWDWTKQKPDDDFGYPMGTTTCMFRKDVILPLLKQFEYKNSGFLEGQINRKGRYVDKPFMCSFNECKIISLPINSVISGVNNPHGDFSAEYLNNQYLDGKIIDVSSIYDIGLNNSFMEYNPNLRFI